MPLIGGNEKEKDTVVAGKGVAAAAAVVVPVVTERVVFVLCPQRKTAKERGEEVEEGEGRIDTWGDRIRGRGSDF